MVNIFKYELKQHFKPVILWVIGIACIQFMMMAIYPTFASDMALVEKMMAYYPEEMLKAFGLNNGLSLSTVTGYLVFSFVYVQLCLAIQSAYMGFSILSKEERNLTADFLMTRPVKRTTIVTSKLLAATLSLFMTLIATFLLTYLSIEIFKSGGSYEFKSLIWLFIGMHFFQWLYLVIGLVISVLLKKIKNVLSFALALSLGTYVLNALRGIVGGKILGWFTPFYYFDLTYIMENHSFEPVLFIFSMVLIVVGVGVTYYAYGKRNFSSL